MSVSPFYHHGSTSVTVQASVLGCDTAANVEWLKYCCLLSELSLTEGEIFLWEMKICSALDVALGLPGCVHE